MIPKPDGEAPQEKIVIERRYHADIADAWSLWTTPEGIESWWGPDGFETKVAQLDLRPGGEMVYTMTAVGPPQVAFMRNAGMPLAIDARVTYTDIVPLQRLAYTHRADFIPGVTPYDVATVVEFHATADGVRMVVMLDRMHSDEWTQRSVMGMESQLAKFATKIAG